MSITKCPGHMRSLKLNFSATVLTLGLKAKIFENLRPWALSIRPKIPEIPGWGANGTDIFRNFIPKFWVYLARLA